VIAVLVVAFYTSGQSLPGISFEPEIVPRCMSLSVLLVGPNYTGSGGNRTVQFGCLFQKSPALRRVNGLGGDWFSNNPPLMSAVPTFNLPKGYLGLYLAGLSCEFPDVPLVSGTPAVFTDYHREYYYCAVVSDDIALTEPFTVHWSQNKALPLITPPVKAVVSSNIAIPAGQNGTTTIIVKWLGTFRGNVSVGVGNAGGPTGTTYPNETRYGGPLTWSVSPTSISPDSFGNGSTTFYVATRHCTAGDGILAPYCTPRGSYYILVFISSDAPYCTLCLHSSLILKVNLNVT